MTPAATIHDVVLTPLRELSDRRGAVLHMLRADAPDFTRFGECYFSEVLPGAVKGWKCHRHQTQNIAVPVGCVRFVIYDERPASPSHAALMVLELGRPDAYQRLRIPPGLWYGFTCLGDRPALLANCADLPHDPADGLTRPEDHPGIPYSWANDGRPSSPTGQAPS